MMASSPSKSSKDPEALKRELWGWYMYDFANSAFFQSAGTVRPSPSPTPLQRCAFCRVSFYRFRLFAHFPALPVTKNKSRRIEICLPPPNNHRRRGTDTSTSTSTSTSNSLLSLSLLRRPQNRNTTIATHNAQIFIPLLVDGLASEYAWSQQGSDRPEYCTTLKDENKTQTDCLRCVEGHGDRLITVDPITGVESQRDTEVLKLPGGINPTSFLFTMVSISVLFQAITFITVGSLGDYGNFRRRGLVAASTFGGVATCCYIFVPASPSLYWLGGLLIILANISLGVSVVFYNSYLPLMVDDSEEVRDAVGASASGVKGRTVPSYSHHDRHVFALKLKA